MYYFVDSKNDDLSDVRRLYGFYCYVVDEI